MQTQDNPTHAAISHVDFMSETLPCHALRGNWQMQTMVGPTGIDSTGQPGSALRAIW